jgi:hypothetical protein
MVPKPGRSTNGEQRSKARRLIAGLRVTAHEEALLAAVRPYLPEADSEGELAYRLWRRGLELTLAEVASLGLPLPAGLTEELLISLVAQRLMLCLPLLRRTGTLSLLGMEAVATGPPPAPPPIVTAAETIDEGAAEAIANLGGNDFL